MEPQNLYSVKTPPHTHPFVSWDRWMPVVIEACPSRLKWMEQSIRGPVLVVPPPECVSLGKEHASPESTSALEGGEKKASFLGGFRVCTNLKAV